MEKTINTITIMPFTKVEKETYINNVVNEFNFLPEHEQQKLFIQMKIVVDTFGEIMKHKDIRGALISRMENKRIETAYGEITHSERKTWDFSKDSKWHELNNKMEELKKEMKAQEGLLKVLKSEMADSETGEIRTPASYCSTEVLTVKLK